MIHPAVQQWQAFGVAVALALQAAQQDKIVQELPEVTAEDIFLAEGRCARFGHPLSCGRLPVAVAGVACLVPLAEVRRYWGEFKPLPGAL